MPATVVVGSQWGDEGKGKIVDFLAAGATAVARYNGGANSGHTVVAKGVTYKLHLIPSGLLRKNITLILGNGMVLDPEVLAQEVRLVERENPSAKICISSRAHVVMPYHKIFDAGTEKGRKDKKIGTTARGIGPAYADKMHRAEAVRVGDLLNGDLKDKVAWLLLQKKENLRNFAINPNGSYLEETARNLKKQTRVFAKYVCDTTQIINELLDRGKQVLLEGAQATLLDIDHGTFPYVSSSNATAGGACTGLGISPTKIKKVIGVAKAYTTRVGEGPFPTELFDKTAEYIRERGREFGTTTGRPRRCGWLDLPMLAYSHRINSFDALAITKPDVLSGLHPVKVCVGYQYRGKNREFTPEVGELAKLVPVYKEFEGWANLRPPLPPNAKKYLRFVEDYLNIPVKITSYGPGRNQTMAKS